MKQLNSEGNTDEKEGEKISLDMGIGVVMIMYRRARKSETGR